MVCQRISAKFCKILMICPSRIVAEGRENCFFLPFRAMNYTLERKDRVEWRFLLFPNLFPCRRFAANLYYTKSKVGFAEFPTTHTDVCPNLQAIIDGHSTKYSGANFYQICFPISRNRHLIIKEML